MHSVAMLLQSETVFRQVSLLQIGSHFKVQLPPLPAIMLFISSRPSSVLTFMKLIFCVFIYFSIWLIFRKSKGFSLVYKYKYDIFSTSALKTSLNLSLILRRPLLCFCSYWPRSNPLPFCSNSIDAGRMQRAGQEPTYRSFRKNYDCDKVNGSSFLHSDRTAKTQIQNDLRNMDNDQLPLFDQQNQIMTEGYEKMAAFRFNEAGQVFRNIGKTFVQPEPETEAALNCISYWKKVFEQLENTDCPDAVSFLYGEIDRYDFANSWGAQKFRSALINHLSGLMRSQDRFYVNEQATLSDLYLQLEKHHKAQQVLMDHLNARPSDNHARFRLAQLQWNYNQKGEAIRNYALGLLWDPQTAPSEFLESEEIADLIKKYGPEMAPAYGWIEGILPLLSVPDELSPVSEDHHKALECYRLLRKAEKASRNNQMEACVEYRKALKERWPKLYEAYYALLSKRTQPYFH